MDSPPRGANLDRLERMVAVALLFVTALRLWLAGIIPLSDDEAYYRLWSLAPAWSYLDHPPMVAWFIAAGRAVAGDSALGVRLAGPLVSLLAGVILWRIAALLFDRHVAAWSVLIALAMPLLGAGAIVITPDLPSTLFFLLGVWALAELQASGRARWWLGVGACAGLGLLSKYTNLFFGGTILLWLLASRERWRWFASWQLWAGGILAMVLALPVVIWNAEHDWASFAKQLGRVVEQRAPGPLTFLEFLGALIVLASPVIAVFAARGTYRAARALIAQPSPAQALLAAAILPLLAYFAFHAVSDRVQANWLAPLYPFLALAAAAQLCAIGDGGHRRSSQFAALAIGFVMTGAIYLHAAHPLIVRAEWREPTHQLRGWPEFARQVEDLAKAQGASWIATSSYATTAQLNLHLKGRLPVIQLDERLRYVHLPPPPPDLLMKPALYVELARRARGDLLSERFGEVAAPMRLARSHAAIPLADYTAIAIARPRGAVLGPDFKAPRSSRAGQTARTPKNESAKHTAVTD